VSSPDIFLAAGDTAPVTQFTLRAPDDEQGNQGDPLDLTGATVVLRLQPKNRSASATSRAATILGDPTLGETELDWATTGGPIAPGDYVCRYIVTTADGHQISVPNGDRVAASGFDALGDDDDTFFWLQVAPDFTAVP
jgi:hypothetical protein